MAQIARDQGGCLASPTEPTRPTTVRSIKRARPEQPEVLRSARVVDLVAVRRRHLLLYVALRALRSPHHCVRPL